MTTTALAAVCTAANRPFELRAIPLAQPKNGEILVRVKCCTLCRSDLHTYEGRRPSPMPSILGHEIIGQIAEFGEDAPRQDVAGEMLQVGDRITWSLAASCGKCFYCRRGLPQKCDTLFKYGHELLAPGREFNGGLAEYCFLRPGTTLCKIPPDMPDEVACPANCATATIAAALEAAGDLRGCNVLVVGAGMLGLTACAMAQSQGAATIVCCDIEPHRLLLSRSFGASLTALPEELPHAIAAATGDYGVDVVFEISGQPAAYEAAYPLVRKGGAIVLVGSVFAAPPVSLELEQVVRRQLTLRGVHNYAPRHLLQAVRFLAEYRAYPFASLIHDRLPLDEVQTAFRTACNPKVIRIAVRMQS